MISEPDFDNYDKVSIDGPIDIGASVVLASGSPYRKQLLEECGVEFAVLASDVDESLQPIVEPRKYAEQLALRKAQSVANRCNDALVIGADTICAMGSEIIGKPRDEADAEAMIVKACEAGLQRVISGIAIIDSRTMETRSASITSLVEMRDAPIEVIRAWVKTGEPMGKCGALCIEGNHQFVKGHKGSYSNIMGLPLEWLIPNLLAMADKRLLSAE